MIKKLNKSSLTNIEKILCASIALNHDEINEESLTSLISKVHLNDLLEASITDEVVSHLVNMFHILNVTIPEKWAKYHWNVESRIKNLMDELEKVAIVLKAHNISVVGLKNAGINKGIYKNNACSPMGDIDLLVKSCDFYQAHYILIDKLYYTFKFRSELEVEDLEEAFKGGGTEYYKDVNGYKVWLELQWRPVAGRWIQPHNEPNGDELMKRSIPIEGSAVRLLAPEDNLLQVCLHTAKHSYCRAPGFRLHTDVDRIVHFSKIDWKHFLALVKKMKLQTAVYYSLLIPKGLLHTPVPQYVIDTLRPNWLRRFIIENLLSKAGLFNQHKKKFSKLGYIIFNLSLYDSLKEITVAIIPSSEIMKQRYGFQKSILLPYYHFKRLMSLLVKRAKL